MIKYCVWSAVGSTTDKVVSCASAVAPSNITAFAACIVTVSTCVVVPATVRFGTSSSPVLGLYRNAPVSSNNAFDSSWKTTGKFVFAVLSETVTVVATAAVPEYPEEVIVPRLEPASANVIVPLSASKVIPPAESSVTVVPASSAVPSAVI